jgi:hypothetical protein
MFKGKSSWSLGVIGVLICLAWFDHMASFGKLYFAKLETLRSLEDELNVLKPFAKETAILKKPANAAENSRDNNEEKPKWRYRPLTVLDRIVPAVCVLLFIGLLVFKFTG